MICIYWYNKFILKICLFVIVFLTKSIALPFYEDHAKGWFWYENMNQEEDEDNQKEDTPPLPFQQEKHPAVKALEMYKKNLEEKKAIALVNPTDHNVQNYMVAQKDMMDRSHKFSKVWKKVLLQTPELNFEQTFPTPQYLRHVFDDEKQNREEQILKESSKKYGLFLFVSKGCAYCKAFAPIVKVFSKKYGFHVMVVTINGPVDQDILQHFDRIQADNGMKDAFGITQAPVLLAFDANTHDVIPISFGATSLDILTNNFITLLMDIGDK